MKFRTLWIQGLITVGVFCLATTANAILITHNFGGTVAELTADAGLFGLSADVGDAFTGHFTYELDSGLNPDQFPSNPEFGLYNVIDFVVDTSDPLVAISPQNLTIIHQAPGPPLPCFAPCSPAPDPGLDSFSIVATSPLYPGSIILLLEAPFGTFSSDLLPSTLNMSQFTLSASLSGSETAAPGTLVVSSTLDRGTISSLAQNGTSVPVPEPATFLLLGIGLLGLIGIRVAQNRRCRTIC